MLIAGVLCVTAAVISTTFGICTLLRPRTAEPAQLVLRAMAPAQLAAAAMLAAGGAVALVGPPVGAVGVLAISVLGAVGTLAAGSWQGARYALRHPAETSCGGGCGCSQACPSVGLVAAQVNGVGGQHG